MKRSRLATYAIGIAVAAAMTGCGGDDDGGDDSSDFADKSAADIVEAATEAMGGLESMRVAGEMTSEAQQGTIDMQLGSDGNCTGSLALGETGKIDILGVDGERWFRGDEAFWSTTGVPDPSAVIGKWVADEGDDFAEFCSVEDFVEGLFTDESEEKYESKGTDSVDGEDVVVIEQDDTEDGVSTGFILADEPHYMVKIEKEGAEGGSIAFSEFDEDFDVTAPSEDEIAQLG
jgi:hypothetical protein